jgi:lysophospholipase L1-like esterase/ribosomal protein S18 acetylase RimI-like enzyme
VEGELKILCYGDSNTWGFSPKDGSRFPEQIRWPGVLRRCLGQGYTVIEDGLNGRTLCAFAKEGDPLNGAEHLVSVVGAHKRLDLVIIYLGINDLLVDPRLRTEAMARELAAAIEAMRGVDSSIKLLVLSPLPVNRDPEYDPQYREQTESSLRLSALLKKVVEQTGGRFFDPSQVISASNHDGVHIEAEEHIKLGLHLCALVREALAGGRAGNTVQIVALTEQDLSALAELYRQFRGEQSSLEAMRKTFRRLARDTNYTLLGARLRDRLVGSVMGVLCGELYGECRPFMVVEDMIVDRTHRRQGIGSLLMRAIETRAVRSNCSYIMLVTDSSRREALAFYQSLGYHLNDYRGFKKYLSTGSVPPPASSSEPLLEPPQVHD